jgi:hypothetical protein
MVAAPISGHFEHIGLFEHQRKEQKEKRSTELWKAGYLWGAAAPRCNTHRGRAPARGLAIMRRHAAAGHALGGSLAQCTTWKRVLRAPGNERFDGEGYSVLQS